MFETVLIVLDKIVGPLLQYVRANGFFAPEMKLGYLRGLIIIKGVTYSSGLTR